MQNKDGKTGSRPETESLCVMLLGEAVTAESAAAYQRMISACPYSAACTTSGRLVLSAFVLPSRQRWWIEGAVERPELLGLEQAKLIFSDFSPANSPWSRGEARPELDAPPCESNCAGCPMYMAYCEGCPLWKGKKKTST